MVSSVFDEQQILRQAEAAGIDIERLRANIRDQELAGVLKRDVDGSLVVVPLHQRPSRHGCSC